MNVVYETDYHDDDRRGGGVDEDDVANRVDVDVDAALASRICCGFMARSLTRI